MAGKDNQIKSIASEFVTPIILKFIENFNCTDLQQAIEKSVSIAQALQADGETLSSIRQWASLATPWFDDIRAVTASRKWVEWFINEPLKTERPGLYAIIHFHPKGPDWLCTQTKEVTDLLLG